MKKALISPQENLEVVSEWKWDGKTWCPIYTEIENSARVAQVNESGTEFEVASPLFWIDCEDTVEMDQFYYDTLNKIIIKIPATIPQPSSTLEN
jgi:hypothetical protein